MPVARRRRAATEATTFKLCSLLLLYPDAELVAGRAELAAAVASLPRSEAADALGRFMDWWGTTEPLALEQHYVETFDLHKRSGLYVTFYGEGDKRERGTALLRLRRLYRAAGLPQEGSELPDYLPVMLEFAAAAPPGHGRALLGEHRPAIELVRASLRDLGTPYAGVLDTICHTLGEPSAAVRETVGRLAAMGPPQELVGLEPFAPPEVMPNMEPMR
jgi:nitrate reductase delta subunit